MVGPDRTFDAEFVRSLLHLSIWQKLLRPQLGRQLPYLRHLLKSLSVPFLPGCIQNNFDKRFTCCWVRLLQNIRSDFNQKESNISIPFSKTSPISCESISPIEERIWYASQIIFPPYSIRCEPSSHSGQIHLIQCMKHRVLLLQPENPAWHLLMVFQ